MSNEPVSAFREARRERLLQFYRQTAEGFPQRVSVPSEHLGGMAAQHEDMVLDDVAR